MRQIKWPKKNYNYLKIKSKNIYFLEFSTSQNCFHVDDLASILLANNDLCNRNTSTGYVVIDGPFEAYEGAMMAIKKFPHLMKRVTFP